MTPLELAVLARNARLRAYQAIGVPIQGGWRYLGELPDTPGVVWAKWSAWCGVCGDYRDVLQRDPAALALYEEEQGIPDCQHMGRILDPDPPAVRDIMELELLAGG